MSAHVEPPVETDLESPVCAAAGKSALLQVIAVDNCRGISGDPQTLVLVMQGPPMWRTNDPRPGTAKGRPVKQGASQ